MIYKHLKISSLITLLLFFFSISLHGEATPDAGKTLFKNYCAQCHAKNMKSKLTGPPLGGAAENWDSQEDLYSWIRNSQKMIAEGHPRAVELWNEWKPTQMTSFEALTDEEIGSILLYVDAVVNAPVVNKDPRDPETSGTSNKTSNWVYVGLAALLGFLALLLSRIVGNLDRLAAAKDGRVVEPKNIFQTLTSKGVVLFALFAFIILAGYTTVNRATNLSRQQGYKPDQPIEFSHETHAGLHKIECQYCHDGARRSKHSVIPAANTCMNCHTAIRYGSEHGAGELTKIYASVGYDPSSGKYIDGYEDMSQEEQKTIYTKWFGEALIENDDDVTAIGAEEERLIADQWENLVSSLTNDQKTSIYGPIEWIRIHNLPDHVYFNHAQHVSVGKVDCQTCHGKIEEMDVVQQMAPLSMGWCINCHRQTEVKFNENDYYKSYVSYHEEMKDGKREKVTVADIGGLECQKCHY